MKFPSVAPKLTRAGCEEALRGEAWFSVVAPALQDRLLAAARWGEFAAGEQISMAGEGQGGLTGIARGAVSSRTATAPADVAMTDIHWGPEFYISRAQLPGEQRAMTVVAQTPVTAMHVPGLQMAQLIGDHPEFRHDLLRLVSATFTRISVALSDALIRSADQRCVAVLLRAAGRRQTGNGEGLVPVGQLDLAGMTNLSRQKVGDVLRDLESRGLVELGYRRIRIPEPDRLRALLED